MFQGWDNVVSLGKPDYRLSVDIAQTGADVVTRLKIPKRCRAVNMSITHRDAAGALTADAMDLTLEREDGDEFELLLDEPGSTTSQYTLPWTDDPIAPCWWVFTTNTDNTDVVRVRFRVRALK